LWNLFTDIIVPVHVKSIECVYRYVWRYQATDIIYMYLYTLLYHTLYWLISAASAVGFIFILNEQKKLTRLPDYIVNRERCIHYYYYYYSGDRRTARADETGTRETNKKNGIWYFAFYSCCVLSAVFTFNFYWGDRWWRRRRGSCYT